MISWVIALVSLLPVSPKPSRQQLEWQSLEYYAFVHFGPNSFLNIEWGDGRAKPSIFFPEKLDCRQWCRIFRNAGMKAVILTAKHHDGFCLWPSKYSTYSVAQSTWKNGKGDVLLELSNACKEFGLKFGVYLSPWDRNHPSYGTPEYNRVFAAMLKEVLTQYGPIFEVWFDGANGEGPNGKRQIYDWDLFVRTVRKFQPNAVIFSDAGPDVRWIGNENGFAGETNWSTINRDRYFPGTNKYNELTEGDLLGRDWVPAECDVSIRPSWFFKESESTQLKSVDQLMSIWHRSVGRNANLLLNVPPRPDGTIDKSDEKRLENFKQARDAIYKNNLASRAIRSKNSITFKNPTTINKVRIRENIENGQQIMRFRVDATIGDKTITLVTGTTIGASRILSFQSAKVEKIEVIVELSKGSPQIEKIEAFFDGKEKQLENREEKDARMAWFRDARFGMFIHWGLYSIPAGEWNGRIYPGASEWLIHHAKIPISKYLPLREQFNPINFDARRWVQIAKSAGMKYIVITSKHHEGFAMWPTSTTDWSIKNTKFSRDPLKELAIACKESNIRLCFYYSIMDWHHPDYLPRRDWDPRPNESPEFGRYVQYMKDQLKELITNYGPIGILWFDGEWEDTWTHEMGLDLEKYVRSLQPDIIINNRVDKGREGMEGLTAGEQFGGDYGSPEQTIPARGLPGVDWESCMTFNDSWGFMKSDNNWKSAEAVIRNLADTASKGGNYLLNVGPNSLGEIPEPSIDRLAAVGKWISKNGEAIYGTTAGPFPQALPWGRVTRKGHSLYLLVDSPMPKEILLRGMSTEVKRISPISNPNINCSFKKSQDGLIVQIGGSSTEPITVLKLDFVGELKIEPVPVRPLANGSLSLEANCAEIEGPMAKFEADKNCIGFWTSEKTRVWWQFAGLKTQDYNIELEYACLPGCENSLVSICINDSRLNFKVTATNSWSDFRVVIVGHANISGSGQLWVVPEDKPNNAVMNLRSVRLIPRK